MLWIADEADNAMGSSKGFRAVDCVVSRTRRTMTDDTAGRVR